MDSEIKELWKIVNDACKKYMHRKFWYNFTIFVLLEAESVAECSS
jgi:hypothetical protein